VISFDGFFAWPGTTEIGISSLSCGSVFGVIIADGSGIYDPSAYHDRLLLGLSGI